MVRLPSYLSLTAGLLSLAVMSEARATHKLLDASSSGSNSTSSSSSSSSSSGTAVTPTYPGPGAVFKTGSQCTMQWTVGTEGKWKAMSIDLMTGDNQSMVKLTNVGSDIDGTSLSSYSWTCPDVSPNAAIYFYQFTDKNGLNPTWTTRFTIAAADGTTEEPSNATQPDGEAIPWGTGSVLSTSSNSTSSSTSSSDSSNSDSSSSTSSSSAAPSSSSSSSQTATKSNGASSLLVSSNWYSLGFGVLTVAAGALMA